MLEYTADPSNKDGGDRACGGVARHPKSVLKLLQGFSLKGQLVTSTFLSTSLPSLS